MSSAPHWTRNFSRRRHESLPPVERRGLYFVRMVLAEGAAGRRSRAPGQIATIHKADDPPSQPYLVSDPFSSHPHPPLSQSVGAFLGAVPTGPAGRVPDCHGSAQTALTGSKVLAVSGSARRPRRRCIPIMTQRSDRNRVTRGTRLAGEIDSPASRPAWARPDTVPARWRGRHEVKEVWAVVGSLSISSSNVMVNAAGFQMTRAEA